MRTEKRPSTVAFAISGRRRAVLALVAVGYLGGLAEALFLVLVTRTAFAITDQKQVVGIIAGWFLNLNLALLLGLGLVSLRLLLAWWASWRSAQLSANVMAGVRHQVANAFMDSSWEVQQNQRSGSLQELLTTFSGSTSAMVAGISGGATAAANLAALVGLAVAVDPPGAAAIIVSVAVFGLCLRPLRKIVRKRAAIGADIGMEYATTLNEVSQLGLELHVFNVQAQARERIGALTDRGRDAGARMGYASGLTSPIYSALAYLALLLALVVVSSTNTTNITSLGAVMLIMLRSLSYGQALQNSYTTIASASPSIEELQRQLEIFERGRRHDGGESIESIGVLRVDSISFGYVEQEPVLRDISFTIEKREIVGIVGPSGGGKSTLVQLLLGLRDADEGRIQVDGRDVRNFAKSDWARRTTFVPQAAHFIAGSIADNIRFMRPGVSDEDVIRAARLAHLHEEIVAFPDGYNRLVGEQGGHLSGGQQQRLCIARALVESPDLLILDEPTSALDVRSEHLVRTSLLELRERMTVIIIAHRLSTLDMCDRIMVIQDGELKGFDSPASLKESNDFYREALELSGMR